PSTSALSLPDALPILHAARNAGLSTAAAKPVASGCERTAEGLRNDDALALLAECTLPLRYEAVNPFSFEPAIAPHLAAREAGIRSEEHTSELQSRENL